MNGEPIGEWIGWLFQVALIGAIPLVLLVTLVQLVKWAWYL